GGEAPAAAGEGHARLREGGGDGRWREPRRGRFADHAEQEAAGAVPGRRGARPGRVDRRVQLPVRLEHRLARRAGVVSATPQAAMKAACGVAPCSPCPFRVTMHPSRLNGTRACPWTGPRWLSSSANTTDPC